MDSRGIFQAPGAPSESAAIREALDTGDALPAGADPRSIAQVGYCSIDFLSYLNSSYSCNPLFFSFAPLLNSRYS